MTYRIKEIETAVIYDDIYNTVSEAQRQIEEYIKDDNDPKEPRTTTVNYIIIDDNGNDVTNQECREVVKMNNKMRVWWIPQVGINATFYIPVESVEEAKKFMDMLAAYDCFQYNHEIKPDYCNAGGLQMWDEEEQDWVDWYFDDGDNYYDDVDEYCEEFSEKSDELQGFNFEMFEQVHFD